MAVRIGERVYAIPVVDRETDLFESLWPVSDGVNYNSYVVVGSGGAAVIDTVHESFFDGYVEELRSVVNLEDVRYVVVNHMEPDHSSSLPLLLEHLPNAKVVISRTGATLFNIPGDVVPVGDGDSVSLGDRTLKFLNTPWIHWPETMVTFVPEEGILFSCDLFGAYGSYPDLVVDDWEEYIVEARRYYVTVLSKYSRFVGSALEKVRSLSPKVVAPAHGVTYSGEDLRRILDLYAEWSTNSGEGRVLILYGSMYGSVYERVRALYSLLESEGVDVDALDLSREDWSYAMSLVLGADVVVVAYPTYEGDVFPPVRFFLQLLREKNLLSGSRIFVVEAHGWQSSEKRALELLKGLNVEEVVSFSQKQPLKMEDLERLVDKIVSALSSG